MNLAFIAIAVLIVAASLINRSHSVNESEVVEEIQQEVLSEETETPEETATANPTVVPTSTPKSTSPQPTSTPVSTASTQTSNNSGWAYPNSTVVASGEKLVLSSSDSTDTITDWYRNKIESEGYNVRSSVKTSANDNIKNVISAAKNNANVNVEITKGPSDTTARIEVKASSL